MTLLALTHRLPWAPNRGDRIRAFHLLKALARRYEVHLLSLVHDSDEESRAPEMSSWLASVTAVRVPKLRNRCRAALALAGPSPLTFALLDSPTLQGTLAGLVQRVQPAMVLAYCSGMARLLETPALRGIPSVLDMVDVDSGKWAALAKATPAPLAWLYAREARLLARAEARQMLSARVTTVVNEREQAVAHGLAPGADVRVVPNGIDTEVFQPTTPPATGARVVFCGVMSYRPNADTAVFLARDVWPLVVAQRPDARLALVGSEPSAALRHAAGALPSIVVTGHVADVRPWLWESAVAAAPLRTARGVQNKVLEAIAAGLPVVVSPAVLDGLPSEVHPACVLAEEAPACAAAIVHLLSLSPDARRARARTASLEPLAWSERLRPMIELADTLTGQ